ncbi:MAG: hypothetical protein EOP04_27895 [Proteobacteria bacterium]|nr:MAG: hypothetical protein EOP04_27895 [Pseudomonadota bacterium]
MNLAIECQCGKVKGIVKDTDSSTGPRIICLCDDCQAAAHWLGNAQRELDANGGTDITPILPSQVMITTGLSHLKSFLLTEKGSLRWYTECCRSALGNTDRQGKVPYVGFKSNRLRNPEGRLEDALGPIIGYIQGKYGIPPLPPGTPKSFSLATMFPYIGFMVKGYFKSAGRPHPLFTTDHKPISEPYILTPVERENLRKYCGPRPKALHS